MSWLRSLDVWDWFKVACLLAFACGVGPLKRRQFDQELREYQARQVDKE